MSETTAEKQGRPIDLMHEAFPDTVQKGDEFWFRCPAHDDNHESASFRESTDGKVLVKCLAGCSTDEVLSAVGLSTRNLSAKQAKKTWFIEAIYPYQDESGKLLFQVLRLKPKNFVQRQPSTDGRWKYSKAGVRNVPFRLPVIISQPGRPVLIVEGEKDVLNALKLDLLATCNAGGAGKWTAEHAKHLHGRPVLIVPDKDQPGQKHAQQVALSLQGIARSVRIVHLPGDGKDLSDWIAAGGTKEQFKELATAAAAWEPSDVDELEQDMAIIANGEKIGTGKEAERVAFSMNEMIERLRKVTGDWPRQVSHVLFVHEGGEVHYLPDPAALFGYFRRKAEVLWMIGDTFCTKGEFFAELERTATAYRSIATFPHFPPIAGHYYAHDPIEPGDGAALNAVLDKLSPATPIDRDLLLAAIVTPAWGGAGGSRPAFLITSDRGRGMGKTTVAKVVGRIWNGIFDFCNDEDAVGIKTRLLTPDSITTRVALVDNIKAQRFSWAELEALITADTISGHRMYKGEGVRPNIITWFLTLNGPALSRDLAQRSVPVKLSRPTYSKTWESDLNQFIDRHRWQIVSDVAKFFAEPESDLTNYTRWGSWERAVLSRLPEPAEAQKVIAERQAAINGDDDEAGELEDLFAQKLRHYGYDDAEDWVHIPNAIAAQWYQEATGVKISPTAMTRTVRQAAAEEICTRLTVNSSNANGRGLLWAPSKINTGVYYDLRDMIAVKNSSKDWNQ